MAIGKFISDWALAPKSDSTFTSNFDDFGKFSSIGLVTENVQKKSIIQLACIFYLF